VILRADRARPGSYALAARTAGSWRTGKLTERLMKQRLGPLAVGWVG